MEQYLPLFKSFYKASNLTSLFNNLLTAFIADLAHKSDYFKNNYSSVSPLFTSKYSIFIKPPSSISFIT